MSWEKKLSICEELLSEIISDMEAISEKRVGDIDFLKSTSQALKDYVSSNEFIEESNEKKEDESFDILNDTLDTCMKYVDIMRKKKNLVPKEKISSEKVSEILMEEYEKAIEEGYGDIYGLNISDWLEEHSFVIEDESSSSSSN